MSKHREDLMDSINSAKKSLAKTAITTPYIYHEYGVWKAAIKERDAAEEKLKIAEARWLRMIEPALDDPLLKALAVREDLIPKKRKK